MINVVVTAFFLFAGSWRGMQRTTEGTRVPTLLGTFRYAMLDVKCRLVTGNLVLATPS